MKKIVLLFATCLILFSCTRESSEVQDISLDVTVQKSNWKTASISNEIINNQKGISHYDFDIQKLNELIVNEKVNYVWFDLGLNDNNQITFTATGVDVNDNVVENVGSTIVSTGKQNIDFSVFNRVPDLSLDADPKSTHILPNKDAFKYLTNVERSYNDFEAMLLNNGQRVERFGLDKIIIERILMTKGINSLGLFLGVNSNNKFTTVFIAKDKNETLIINNSRDINTSGHAFDFTSPCPPDCGSDCGGCAEYCDWPIWICCLAQPPCDDGGGGGSWLGSNQGNE